MIVGHSRQKTGTWSASGTGAAILTSTSQLVDGRPGTLTRCQWISGSQTTSSVTRLRLDWSTGFVPGLVGLSNLSLPVGTLISARYRRSTDSAGTYPYNPTAYNATQRIVEGPFGERTWWTLLQAGATAIVGVEFQFWNDVNGSASISASSTFDIGEAWISPTTEFDAAPGISIDDTDPTTINYTPTRQPYAVPGTPYRQLQFRLRTASQDDWFAIYRPLLARLTGGEVAAYIPRYQDTSGAFDADLLHSYAMLGTLQRLPGMSHRAGPWFESDQATVIESPIPT